MTDDITKGSRVRVDLSIRYEDVDKVVDAVVYRVERGENLPFYIDAQGRVFRISSESIIEVLQQ